jgi:hypothetical protein
MMGYETDVGLRGEAVGRRRGQKWTWSKRGVVKSGRGQKGGVAKKGRGQKWAEPKVGF